MGMLWDAILAFSFPLAAGTARTQGAERAPRGVPLSAGARQSEACPMPGMEEASILFLRACLALLVLPIHVLAGLGLWQPFCRRVFFPFVLARISAAYERKAKGQKQELFRSLPDFRNPSGDLNLLEIGTGFGVNFPFYPPGCKVTCSDPNPGFRQGLLRSMARNQHVHYERFLVAAGEDLHQVPSGSMDAVVCTLVLCSVRRQSSVLQEVLRVLRPGGAFFFVEHVAAERCSRERFWQQVWTPTWELLFDGCCPAKETWKALEEAAFSELHLQRGSIALAWTPTHPHIIGYAVK